MGCGGVGHGCGVIFIQRFLACHVVGRALMGGIRQFSAAGRASAQGGSGGAGEQDWGAKGIGRIVHAGGAALPDRVGVVSGI